MNPSGREMNWSDWESSRTLLLISSWIDVVVISEGRALFSLQMFELCLSKGPFIKDTYSATSLTANWLIGFHSPATAK